MLFIQNMVRNPCFGEIKKIFNHPLHIFLAHRMVDREADHLIGHLSGNREVRRRRARQAPVHRKRTDERIEVPPSPDIPLAHPEVKLIPGHPIPASIHENREITVVMTHTGHIVPESDTLDRAQGLAVFHSDPAPSLDRGIDLHKIQQAVSRADFIQLSIDARSDHFRLSRKAEVLEEIDPFLRLLVVHHHRSAFDRVEDLGRMKTQGAHIAFEEDAPALHFDAEGMGGIIDDFQPVLIGDLLNSSRVAGLSRDMNRQDRRRPRRDRGFDLSGIHTARIPVDVHEDRLDSVPP